MVNLCKTFSIAVVFVVTLALLAVPALAPPVASANGPLPNPLTVNFAATVSEGDNITFNVVPNATFGTVLNQFGRPWMVINQTSHNNTAARFFNMSTASGTVSGDLSGSIGFRWNRIDFEVPYFNSPAWYLASPTGLGLLYIQGTMNDTELGNLTFVGAVDLDYNSTLVRGEGIVWTVENWAEGCVQAPSRVLIGEMSYEYVESTGAMTGTFSLRHYMENPVGLAGKVSTVMSYLELEGQLINDEKDWITTDQAVMFNQFSKDPVMTAGQAPRRVEFEEMTVGRESPQDIVAGTSGVGGTISLLRTGVLDVINVAGQDIPVYAVTGTRTTEDNTGSNISIMRGVAKTIVLVDMVDFDIDTGVDQQAYTAMPGYSPGYLGTGHYAGWESYVIAATNIDTSLYLSGPDYRWNLLPTPLVSTVNPTEEGRGNTTNVTINGKWFWTNTSHYPLTVDFGPGITTNSYTVVNDTQVIANITVAGDAFVGPRDVKVTKRGVEGELDGGFAVSGPTGLLNGTFSFAAGSMDGRGLVVNFYDPGTKGLLFTGNVVTDASGNFSIEAGVGTYDIGAKNCTCLSEMVSGKQVTENGTTYADFGTSREGDCNEDDMVTSMDRGLLYDGWNSFNIYQGGHLCDLNRDTMLTSMDRGLMYDNWNTGGDELLY